MRRSLFCLLAVFMLLVGEYAEGAVTLNSTTIALTSLQIKDLKNSPILVVPAPGIGSVIIPVSMQIKFIYGGSNKFDGSGSTFFSYGSHNSFASVNNSIFWDRTQNYYSFLNGPNQISSAVNVENQPIMISSTSQIYGNPSNDNTAEVNVVYYTISL